MQMLHRYALCCGDMYTYICQHGGSVPLSYGSCLGFLYDCEKVPDETTTHMEALCNTCALMPLKAHFGINLKFSSFRSNICSSHDVRSFVLKNSHGHRHTHERHGTACDVQKALRSDRLSRSRATFHGAPRLRERSRRRIRHAHPWNGLEADNLPKFPQKLFPAEPCGGAGDETSARALAWFGVAAFCVALPLGLLLAVLLVVRGVVTRPFYIFLVRALFAGAPPLVATRRVLRGVGSYTRARCGVEVSE